MQTKKLAMGDGRPGIERVARIIPPAQRKKCL
jgi:hypothetical protein